MKGYQERRNTSGKNAINGRCLTMLPELRRRLSQFRYAVQFDGVFDGVSAVWKLRCSFVNATSWSSLDRLLRR
jgi:hypothetical protein